MYFSKNKNYFRFIIWFLTVALVTFGFGLSILWQAIQPHANLLSLASDQIILSFILIVCLVIILAIIAARYFRLSDNDLFAEQTSEIFKIINIHFYFIFCRNTIINMHHKMTEIFLTSKTYNLG